MAVESEVQVMVGAEGGAQARADIAREVQRAVDAATQDAARQAQVQAQEQLRQAQQQMQDAQRQAQEAQRDAQRAIEDAQREAADAIREAQAGTTPPPPWGPDFPPGGPVVPEGAIIIAIAFFAMCAIIAIGYPLARAFGRRMDRKGAALAQDPDTRVRLERIEQAVDAIALEVERISEGQRFTSKVLADLRALPEPDPAAALAAPMLRARERR